MKTQSEESKLGSKRMNEIKRKAFAGEELTDKSNKAAVALYNQYKNEATALAKDLKREDSTTYKIGANEPGFIASAFGKKARSQLGMGGADYNKLPEDVERVTTNTTSNTMKTSQKQMETDEKLRQTDPKFVRDEIDRTLRVIKRRKQEGLDVVAQEKYLKSLTSGKYKYTASKNKYNPYKEGNM
jgi:hypothetical protein